MRRFAAAARKGTTTVATRTRDEEIQNFANWFQYYRSRISSARAGMGRAFSTLGDTPRVGFATLNTLSQFIDGVSSPGAVLKGVRPFTGRASSPVRAASSSWAAVPSPVREASSSSAVFPFLAGDSCRSRVPRSQRGPVASRPWK